MMIEVMFIRNQIRPVLEGTPLSMFVQCFISYEDKRQIDFLAHRCTLHTVMEIQKNDSSLAHNSLVWHLG